MYNKTINMCVYIQRKEFGFENNNGLYMYLRAKKRRKFRFKGEKKWIV